MQALLRANAQVKSEIEAAVEHSYKAYASLEVEQKG